MTIIIQKQKYGNEEFEGFLWAIKAISKDEKYCLQYLNVTKNHIIGCDGSRLHYFRLKHDYPPGMYEVVSKDKKSIVLNPVTEGKYPNAAIVARVKRGVRLSLCHNPKIRGESYTRVVRSMDEGVTLDLDYFEDAITEGQWRVTIQPNRGPIRFRNYNKVAIIMPIRM